MTSKDFRMVKTFFRRYRERKEDTELYYASPALRKKEDKPDNKRWKEDHAEQERPGGEKISEFRESKGRRATRSNSNDLPSKRVWGMLSLAKGERDCKKWSMKRRKLTPSLENLNIYLERQG